MGRNSSVVLLEPEQQARVDALLRRYRYVRIDQANGELAESGIVLSRSSLHRYAQRLRLMDRVPVIGKGPIVVMILDQRSDVSTVVRTSVAASAVVSAIAALESPDQAAAQPPAEPV